MGKFERIFYNAIIGGIGGLLGWLLVELSYFLNKFNIFIADIVWGGIIGACIGILIGSIEGIFLKSSRKLFKGIVNGLKFGIIGGAIGLLIGEILLNIARGGVFVRGIGWSIFGLLIGISEGRANRDRRKTYYGSIGGFVGGLIGGVLFEILYRFFGNQILSRAIGFVILGACIGYFISLVPILLRNAWLMEIAGVYEGREYTLTKEVTTIGRDELCDIPLFGDTQIAKKHAEIKQENGKFVFYHLASGYKSFINDNEVNKPYVLENKNKLKIGNRVMIFYEKK